MFYDELGNIDRPKAHQFYLYLTHGRPSRFDNPGDWLRRLNVNVELPTPALRDRPLDFFAGNSRDLPTAQLCLEHYITTTSRHRSKAEQRVLYNTEHHRPGRKALAWLLREYDSADLSINTGFLKALVHCLVAEEQGVDFMWSWLKTPYIPAVLKSQEDKREMQVWRGSVLRFFVESQAYWAEGTEGINAALRTFEFSWSFAVPYGEGRWESDPLVMSKRLAGVWIQRRLLFNGANENADVELFEQLISRLPSWRNAVDQSFSRANLLTKHPTKPTGLPALEFISALPSG